jgi:GNAT superfamily N-acetyltransferase
MNSRFSISTDRDKLDVALIHSYLSNESYWGKGRTLETVKLSIANSLCFGVYDGKKQVGFARVITDHATFAYVADVFVLSSHRGNGLSKMLMEAIVSHPQLQGLRRWMLATHDAHRLYEKFGFKPIANTERWMEIFNPPAS